ncbi:MAG: hypothetical protein AB1611_13040, partial [bacterium]
RLSSGPCRIGCSLRLCVSAGDLFSLCALCPLYIISLAYVSAIAFRYYEWLLLLLDIAVKTALL